jgi:predicted nucleotide-binding protein (sugar kinase/HSP70/actin superfamily)
MGAYGAALFARESDARGLEKNSGFNLAESPDAVSYNSRLIKCRGCENRCSVSKLIFENGNIYYTGNRCENIYSNQAAGSEKGENLPAIKNNLLFGRNLSPDSTPKAVLGIPRALNIFENFPFWARLLTECGLEVVISGQSDEEVANKGAGTVMSDNICFPARLVHGHIIDLIEKGVDRIFYPIVTYEQDEIPGANNCYNCPVVSGYPDVIRSSINPEQNYEVPIDLPAFTFRDKRLLAKNCYKYLSQFGITPKQFDSAFKLALRDMRDYKQQVREYAGKIAENAFKTGRKVILLAGRPYHIDPLINHDIPNTIADLGFDVITEDSIPVADHPIDDLKVLSQWAYPNRMYAAAKWAADKDFVEVVQLNSFGCGPDTIAIDEMRELLLSMGKNHTVIRIDEHSCAGSLRLRIRSLIESIRLRETRGTPQPVIPRRHSAPFLKSDRRRTILAPFFSPFHSAFVSAPFRSMGYNVVSLPPSDEETIDYGLRYVNNEICYPATLVIGDVLRALKSGDYDPDDVAVGITQTGGQCRASNYASLLKKALVDAGYGKVPVVGISLARNKLNHQPGFRMKTIDLVKKGILGAIYGDAISDMYYAVAPREAEKGHAARVSEKYIAAAQTAIERGDRRAILQCLAGAVEEFNALPLRQRSAPKVGLVGEIYVKYNPAGNNYIVNDLIDDGIHVVMPPLVNMFTQWLVNVHIKHDKGIENKFISKNFALLLKKYVDRVFASFDAVMAGFRFFSPRHELGHIADLASGVMDMTSHYFGEGWMIAGDISAFAEDGIRDVICLQPFGCIANHVIAKGIEKSLREKYPGLNILYLDIDSGASAVNLHNRLHLLLRRATENV